MSYTRSYSSQVHYSGTASYHYPASEHGGSGSVSYSGSVPVYINIHVDTNDFDRSVGLTNASLLGVANSVLQMQNAECQAIIDSGDKIAKTAINGFFTMINSEVSQQILENHSKLTSSIALLQEQTKLVQQYHNQMNEDFQRIKGRYLKIFNDLDEECFRRIHELDSPAFTLAKNCRNELLVENYTNTPAICFIKTLEDANAHIMLSLARLKTMANRVIENFKQNIKDQNDFSYNTEKYSLTNVLPKEKTYYVPSVVIKSQSLTNDNNAEYTTYYTPEGIDENTKNQFPQTFDAENVAETLDLSSSDKEKINTFFMQQAEDLVSGSENKEHNQRVYDNLIALWNN